MIFAEKCSAPSKLTHPAPPECYPRRRRSCTHGIYPRRPFVCGAFWRPGRTLKSRLSAILFAQSSTDATDIERRANHINYAYANIKERPACGRLRGRLRILEFSKGSSAQSEAENSLFGRRLDVSGGFIRYWPDGRNPQEFHLDSAVAFLERHLLDGLDRDWAYPGQKASITSIGLGPRKN